ncbi:MAG: hypothetical protein ABSH34_28315 [Verrucomicrobiota bacterium]
MAGITWIVAATIAVSTIMSLLFGTFSHWPIVIAGIAVGLWTAKTIK